MLPARENPFAVDRVLAIRYRFLHSSWEELWRRLAELDYRAAIVGPDGTGKTTLLEDLRTPLEDKGFNIRWLRLSREFPRFESGGLRELWRTISPQDIILFDGAEQLSRWGWRWFRHQSRRARGLLITSHRAGMLPTLLQSHTTPQLLSEISGELLPTLDDTWRPLVEELYARHDGNLRLALRELYDLAAEGQLPMSPRP